MAGRHTHLRGLATAIHEISGLKLKTHFAADGFLPCIEQHEIITEIPRVARRALVSFLQKLKKNGKERECHRLLFQCGISTAITSSELNEVNSR